MLLRAMGRVRGADYKPWLRAQDVPSDLEYAYLLALEFSERVVDIREQFPLFPIEPIQERARRQDIRYPRYAGTQVPYVMTTDFVGTVKAEDESLREFTRTVKYEDEFSPGRGLARTLELELERAYWLARGVDWKIVTERSVSPALAKNLIWLYGGAQIERGLERDDLQANDPGYFHAFTWAGATSPPGASQYRSCGSRIARVKAP
jgi:hypothetical protein